jgi:hypothetical protein
MTDLTTYNLGVFTHSLMSRLVKAAVRVIDLPPSFKLAGERFTPHGTWGALKKRRGRICTTYSIEYEPDGTFTRLPYSQTDFTGVRCLRTQQNKTILIQLSSEVRDNRIETDALFVTIGPQPYFTEWHIEDLGISQRSSMLMEKYNANPVPDHKSTPKPFKLWLVGPSTKTGLKEIQQQACAARNANDAVKAALDYVETTSTGFVFMQACGDSFAIPSGVPHLVLTFFPKPSAGKARSSYVILRGVDVFAPRAPGQWGVSIDWVRYYTASNYNAKGSILMWRTLAFAMKRLYPDSFPIADTATLAEIQLCLFSWQKKYELSGLMFHKHTRKRLGALNASRAARKLRKL